MQKAAHFKPGSLLTLTGFYTCAPNPFDKHDRFSLRFYIDDKPQLDSEILLIIALCDCSISCDPFEHDDIWVLCITSSNRCGWIPTGNFVSGAYEFLM